MDAISRERLAGLAFARQQRRAGSAFTGVALSTTLDKRTRATCVLSGSLEIARTDGPPVHAEDGHIVRAHAREALPTGGATDEPGSAPKVNTSDHRSASAYSGKIQACEWGVQKSRPAFENRVRFWGTLRNPDTKEFAASVWVFRPSAVTLANAIEQLDLPSQPTFETMRSNDCLGWLAAAKVRCFLRCCGSFAAGGRSYGAMVVLE